jgi:hypothetical protein
LLDSSEIPQYRQKRVHSNEKDHNSCCGTLHINIDQAILYAVVDYNSLHLTGDIIEAVLGGGGYVDGLLHKTISGLSIPSVYL